MSKLVKELVAKDLAQRYGDTADAVWVELVGVDGITTNAFRRALRARQMRLEVVKTSLFRQACGTGGLAPLAQRLAGPAALVTGGESAIEIAKLLQEWSPKFPPDAFRLRGAVLEGEFLDGAAAAGLHTMPSKRDLHARIVGIALSPGSKIVGAMLAGGANIAGCLKAMIEKLENGEEIKKSA